MFDNNQVKFLKKCLSILSSKYFVQREEWNEIDDTLTVTHAYTTYAINNYEGDYGLYEIETIPATYHEPEDYTEVEIMTNPSFEIVCQELVKHLVSQMLNDLVVAELQL